MYQYFQNHRLQFIILAISLLIFQCRNGQIGASLNAKGVIDLVFLNETNGGELIVTDTLEGYFDKVSIIDMSIQMKKQFSDNFSRMDVLKEYKASLKADVLAFDEDEINFIRDVFREISIFYQKYPGNLLPEKLNFIKVKGSHYGNDVYYTRQDAIIIPAAKLDLADKTSFTTTMIHELFHVISRQQPAKKEIMYGIFGFEKLKCQQILLPDSLEQIALLNPDGISRNWGIRLKINRDTILTIPLIYASKRQFNPHQPEFMSYLEFNLFQVESKGQEVCRIKTKGTAGSTLDVYSIPDFFEQTGRNTNYIIHPDEILADNFLLIYTTHQDPAKLKKLTPKGKALLQSLEKVL
jgi:hypothetical protein